MRFIQIKVFNLYKDYFNSDILYIYSKLTSNLLNPDGPFILLNSLRSIAPGDIHTLIFAFVPQKSSIVNFIFLLKNLVFKIRKLKREELKYLDQ